jgi:PHD/YefM family antitoxin component YafN of YafNO toxin-antitoxin module
MKRVSANDPAQSLSRAVDTAQREPVMIQRDQRDVAVLMSVDEYEKPARARIEDFQAFCDRIAEKAAARGMTEAKLSEILRDG